MSACPRDRRTHVRSLRDGVCLMSNFAVHRGIADVMQAPAIREALDESSAWALVRGVARRASTGQPIGRSRGLVFDGRGGVRDVAPEHGLISVDPSGDPVFRTAARVVPSVAQMLDLYLPLCLGDHSSKMV